MHMKGLLCLRPSSLWSLWGFFNLASFSQQDASQKSCWSRRVDNVVSNLTERKRGPWGNAHYVFMFKLQSSQCTDCYISYGNYKDIRFTLVQRCTNLNFPGLFRFFLTGTDRKFMLPPPRAAQTSCIVSSFFTQLSKQSALLLERSTNK